MIRKAFAVCAAAMLLGATAAYAYPPNPIDLTYAGATYTSTADGTIWSNLKGTTGMTQPAGTGVYDPFLREQANGNGPTGDNGIEEGMNTDATVAEPLDNVGNDPHTHSVLMGNMQVITIGATDYFSFTLDLNEPSGGGQNVLSLDQIKIWTVDGSFGGSLATVGAVAAAGTLRYDMDAVIDQTTWLDYNNSNTEKDHGSGADDMQVLIPTSFFAGYKDTDYMYFWAMFGSAGAQPVQGVDPSWYGEDGFEEWRHAAKEITVFVPEPGSMALLGFGVVAFAGALRRKND